MPERNDATIAAKATSLIFFTVECCFVLRRAFWHTAVRIMHASWTYLCPPLCPISFLLTPEDVCCTNSIAVMFLVVWRFQTCAAYSNTGRMEDL